MTTPFFANSNHVVDEPAAPATDDAAASNLPGDGEPGSVLPSPEPADVAGQSELPEIIRQIREAPERQMYKAEKQYENVFNRGKLGDKLAGEDPEVVKEIDSFAANIYSDMRLSNPEAGQVHSVFSTDVTDEVAADWRAESEAYIKSLGPEGPAKLADAQALARRDPRVLKMLEGAHGNSPILVRLLIEKAYAEKRDGRL